MKKNIWIWNHYATNMSIDKAGRHYWMAKELKKKGYNPIIFCANTLHNSSNTVEVDGKLYTEQDIDGIKFIFIKTTPYKGNGKDRLWNIINFSKNIMRASKRISKILGRPDIIVASSVHPFTLVAGILTARKMKIPCICEIRDLWPESLVAYKIIPENHLVTQILYRGEKWIYKNAHAVIMTWEGGQQYICDKGWQNKIQLGKIVHISNGVCLEDYNNNAVNFRYSDEDLSAGEGKKIVYAGSIRKVNNVGLLLDAAKIVKESSLNIKFLIFGDGDEFSHLKKKIENESISNVILKGKVDKKFIPSILKQADINILHNQSTSLNKYGQSQNKLFEYLAAGKCIIQTYKTEYSVLDKYNCGEVIKTQSAQNIANTIISLISQEQKLNEKGDNALKASFEFDFSVLGSKLINLIEEV